MRELDGLSHVLSAERDWFQAFKRPPVMTVNLRIAQWIDILFILGRGSIARGKLMRITKGLSKNTLLDSQSS